MTQEDVKLLHSAAQKLRDALDPERVRSNHYERLMMDLEWPKMLAAYLDAAARVCEADPQALPENLQIGLRALADSIKQVDMPLLPKKRQEHDFGPVSESTAALVRYATTHHSAEVLVRYQDEDF